jgi:hypothetical protein
VKFELGKVPEGKSIIGLSDEESQELLCEIVAVMIALWEEIEKSASDIERRKGEFIKECDGKISGRTVENLMYAMSILGLAKGESQKIPSWAINEAKEDGENILETILFSKIRFQNEEYLVSDLIFAALKKPGIDLSETTAKDLLRKHGLSVVERKGGWFLAVIPKNVSEYLLKYHDDYKGLDIKAPLERLDGVEKSVKTEWGNQKKPRAMQIPGRHITAISDSDEDEGV